MTNPFVRIRDYFRHSFVELKKVSWPSRQLTIRYSALVVAVSLVLAAFFAALDFGLQEGVNIVFTNAPAQAPAAAPLPEVTPTLVETGDGQSQEIQVESDASTEGGITLPPLTPSN